MSRVGLVVPPMLQSSGVSDEDGHSSSRRLRALFRQLDVTSPTLEKESELWPMPTAGSSLTGGAKVCVTGAGGFIGLHLVKLLLARGCHVTAAVRDTSSKRKLEPLLAMQRAAQPGALKLVGGCDVLSPGSFDAAVADAVVCFHLASPFWMDDRITDPHAELVKPAEQGTINVLTSCAKSQTVRRVVVTSSFGSVMNVGGNNPFPMDFHYSEEHWNKSSAPIDGVFPDPVNVHAYRWSKTAAERAAWNFVETQKPNFDVSCILPPMVLGANMQAITSEKDLNQSSLILFKMLAGQMAHANPGSVGFVDVEDVAKAHILAGELECAGGQRYLCSGVTKTWLEVASMLRGLFPGMPVPSTCADGSTEQPCMLLDNSKIQSELGMRFIPLEQTLNAQGAAFIKAGLLNTP